MPGFQQFIRERQFLSNVTPSTVEWYKNSLKWLPSESPSQEELKGAVMRMREKGLKATGCNCAIRAINAYLHWSNAGTERKCGPGCPHLRVPKVKEPQLILPTFTDQQTRVLITWKPKPKHRYQRRLHLLTLLLLDTGCRITEALTLRVCDAPHTGRQRTQATYCPVFLRIKKSGFPLRCRLQAQAGFASIGEPE
jgi:integrase/recombinase XerD